MLTFDDLIQEGWVVAHKVLRTYDPTRGAKIETVLFVSLHRHFARLLKQSLEKTFRYTAEQQSSLIDYYNMMRLAGADGGGDVISLPNVKRLSARSRALLDTRRGRLLAAKIASLSDDERALVCDLVNMKQNAAKIARKRQWSIPFTQQRIDELKAVLKGAI